ncbi:xaa-Pro aminopeptidase [Tremella mesenterica]|uniref:Xaa-Pro aminopeptidase n=1 Tax=Tremella mesenterica TaxID=5217 RepID=A0A4Q1BDJ0_TREME|nr:xaa-Pro aminopeptidase [Tremella mesenterica]
MLKVATDFFYLTGFDEPEATLVLESNSSSRGYKYTLFVPPKDTHEALWAGECTGVEGAVSIFGADEAHSNTSLSSFLPSLLRSDHVYASPPPLPSPSRSSQPFHPRLPRKRSSLLKLFNATSDSFGDKDPPHLLIAAALAGEKAQPLEKEVQRLRAVKSPNELARMQLAADISSEGHAKVMRFAEPEKSEAQLAAVFEYHCAMNGADRPAYVPVVASGANALVIHYTHNNCLIEHNDLILIDAGCEHSHYAADITRTFPANGKFTPAQRDLYEAVLNAQKECVRRCRIEDGISLNELHRASCSMLTEELRQIGFRLSPGDLERKLYPHFLSHHLGSDLHDCPSTDRSSPLVNGNVVTIEPGIYVPFDNSFPSAFHGIGIRIEDEVAITPNGPLILSSKAPKEIDDVERACQGEN